ncbi:unnamed protein product [Nippostrongylus brasiliensis]|uniref:PDZ domain-containing protein n=1 Tax=Nippostrongylus brasiliensis TaxID=27835 RepID=A0A0N4XWZ3_NIPBR|nr:unnamed protein product [Nippostrongylus brasiliensis]
MQSSEETIVSLRSVLKTIYFHIEKKVVHALRGKNVSKNYYEVLPFTIELQKGQSLGLVIKKDIVVGVKWDSPCLGIIRAGDILYTINRQIFHDDTGKTKDLLSQITQNGGKPKVNVIRFKRRPRMKPFLPKGYEAVEGFDYEWTVLYLMRGMPLGLDVRLIDKKMTSTMVKMLDLKGQVRLLVEFPANDMLRNMIRAKIAAAVGPPEMKDLPVPLEARPWAEKGLAALKDKDPKPIYKEPKGDKKKEDADEKTNRDSKPKNTSFNEKTVEHSYYDDLQTQLIVKVCLAPLSRARVLGLSRLLFHSHAFEQRLFSTRQG